MEIYGDTLIEETSSIDFDLVQKIIKRAVIKPQFKVSVLNPDETVSYVIPSEDIPEGGISYTEEYQSGQRRNITLTLINKDGKYTPSINGIWLTTKFRLDIGLVYKKKVIWFPRGVYIMGDVSLTHQGASNEVEIQLKDKFAQFENKLGTLESGYEVEVGSKIGDAIKGILNFDRGDGYIMDYKPIILDPSLIDFVTQSTIRVDEGGNLGQVISELATQLSAEYYYNNTGNLCFYPINSTVDDSSKPVIWTFQNINRELHNLSLNYKNEEVINVVKVIGDNVGGRIYSAIATNENPSSPICIQRVGRRAAPQYNEANVWSQDLANDLARYYLRQNSFLGVDFTCSVAFNPILVVNNICEVENSFLQYKREKLLITSISYNSQDGLMSLRLCNTSDLPFKS